MAVSRDKYLIKNTAILTIGSLGSKFITFFLIPLYTNSLSTTQYGIVDLIVTINTVLAPIVTVNIGEAVMRFALDVDADRNQISCIGQRFYIASIFISILLIPFFKIVPSLSNYAIYTSLYIIAFSASQLFLCDLRGKEMLLHYSIGSILETLLICVFNILFLVVLKMGIKGYLIAYILAFTVTAIYAYIVGKGYYAFLVKKIDKNLLKEMVKFSLVLIPNTFMWWIINSSDRIMVSSFLGASSNGIYAISYKLPTLVSSFTLIFNRAWSYSAIKEEGAADEKEFNNKIYSYLISIVMIIGIGIIVICKPFLSIYVSKEFYSAWKYMPFLTIGFVFLTLADFISTTFTVHKDSYGFLFSGTLGAVLNIVLNYFLIPKVQIYGAAIATCISYIAVFIFRIIYSRKYIKYDILNAEFLFGTILLVISAFVTFFNGNFYIISNALVIVGAIFLYRKFFLEISERIKIIIKKKR